MLFSESVKEGKTWKENTGGRRRFSTQCHSDVINQELEGNNLIKAQKMEPNHTNTEAGKNQES